MGPVLRKYIAGAVQSQNGKSSGYCYMIGGATILSQPGHVTGPLFCLFHKTHYCLPFSTWSTFELVCRALD